MDLESAVRAALRGKLGIIMKTREEAEAIVDVCREFGALTEYLPIYEVPDHWEVFGVNSDYPEESYPVFWNNWRSFERETDINRSVRCADLLSSLPDLSDVENLL